MYSSFTESFKKKPPILEMINNLCLCLHWRSEKWDNVEIDANSVYTNLYQQSILIVTILSYLKMQRFWEKHLYVCMHLAKICFNEVLPP